MQSVLELVHMFLNEPTWDEAAMERAKQIWVSHHRSLTKSLERSTADRVMEAMLGPERYVPPAVCSGHGDMKDSLMTLSVCLAIGHCCIEQLFNL